MVLVVHEIFGVHEHIKDVCRRFAKEGYYAIAPELFARQGDVSKLTDTKRSSAKSCPKCRTRRCCRTWTRPWPSPRRIRTRIPRSWRLPVFVGVGALLGCMRPSNRQLKAAVAWYGKITGEKDELHPRFPADVVSSLKAPVLGFMAEKIRGFRSLPWSNKRKRWPHPRTLPQRPPAFTSIQTRATLSLPTIVRAFSKSRPKTAGSARSIGSRATTRSSSVKHHEDQTTGPHRPQGERNLPGYDDLRQPMRRSGVLRDHGQSLRSGRVLLRYRGRVSARCHAGNARQHGDDRRQMDRRAQAARQDRAGQQVPRSDGGGAE